MNTIAMMKRLEQEGVTFWFDKPRAMWIAKLGNTDVCERKYLGNLIWDAAEKLGEDDGTLSNASACNVDGSLVPRTGRDADAEHARAPGSQR